MNECIACLVYSFCFFLSWYRIFQIIQTRGERSFLSSFTGSWSSPFLGTYTGSGLSTPALGKTRTGTLILSLRGFLITLRSSALLWFFWNEHSGRYKLLPSSFLPSDAVSCCVTLNFSSHKLEGQCCLCVCLMVAIWCSFSYLLNEEVPEVLLSDLRKT